MVKLNSSSKEYQEVMKEFSKTMTPASQPSSVSQLSPFSQPTPFRHVGQKYLRSGQYTQIDSIERIQNPLLYSQYITRKKKMDEDNPKNHVNERKLFHGTDNQTSLKINQMGFDRNFAGKNGNHGWSLLSDVIAHYKYILIITLHILASALLVKYYIY